MLTIADVLHRLVDAGHWVSDEEQQLAHSAIAREVAGVTEEAAQIDPGPVTDAAAGVAEALTADVTSPAPADPAAAAEGGPA